MLKQTKNVLHLPYYNTDLMIIIIAKAKKSKHYFMALNHFFNVFISNKSYIIKDISLKYSCLCNEKYS